MSSVLPPDASQSLRNHERRLRGLEAVTPTASLITTDGGTTVDPTHTLEIGLGIVLTNPSAAVAEIALSDYQAYTPVLSAVPTTGTDPNIGADGDASGSWVELGNFVHVYGAIDFDGAGVDPGTGTWRVSLPVSSEAAFWLGQMRLLGLNGGADMNVFEFRPQSFGGPPFDSGHFELSYCATPPVGLYTLFDSTSPWSLAAGDVLQWSMVYRLEGGL